VRTAVVVLEAEAVEAAAPEARSVSAAIVAPQRMYMNRGSLVLRDGERFRLRSAAYPTFELAHSQTTALQPEARRLPKSART
jgi:hypothetical protein